MKNPKEEAIDLFNSMKGFRVKHSHSKKCAKVCAQKTIDELQTYSDLESVIIRHGVVASVIDRICYYREVLTELEKL